MCYNIEIFGTHLKFFLENEPALYGFTGAKTGSTFRFLFLLEHVSTNLSGLWGPSLCARTVACVNAVAVNNYY